MRRAFLFIVFFVPWLAAIAQPYSSKGLKFQVDQIRGCAPFTINIVNTNLSGNGGCTAGTPCIMSFDGTNNCPPNASCQNVIKFTYNTPGTYRLQVIYQSTGADYIDVIVDPNIQPAFDIYSCAGSKVEVNITDKTYDTYYVNFNSETDAVIDKTVNSGNNQTAIFNYGAAGNHTISINGQKLNAANNCSAKALPFTAINTLPLPTINSLTATSSTTLQLAYTPATNVEYKSEIATNNATNFQVFQNLYGVNSLTVPNLNVNNNFYCLRLSSFDPCANTNLYPPYPICSQKLSVTAASGANQLSWQTSNLSVSTIDIKRDNSIINTIPGNTTSYQDKTVVCKSSYQYQLVSKYANGSTSTSLLSAPVTAFLIQTPIAINNTSAVVGEPQVDLIWQDPTVTATSYNILRAPQSGSYIPIGNNTSPEFTDESYNNAGYCYQINYTDNCDNVSANSLPSCPVLLAGTMDESNEVTLNWSAYSGWNQGVKNYSLIKYYQPGQAPQTIYSGSNLTYLDNSPDLTNQVVYYKIIATAVEAGVSPSLSNEIKVVRNINLYYPTAFNPDSKISSLNRTFAVKGHFIASMKLEIFDRWGALVFYSDKNEAWDGRREGLAMPDATYVWTADGTDLAGNTFKKAGTVVLIRK